MTKEEQLKQEAEKWAKDHHYYNGTTNGYVAERDSVINAYLASAEPREKRIEELEAENEQIKNSDTLCKLIGEQKRKITELERFIKTQDRKLRQQSLEKEDKGDKRK